MPSERREGMAAVAKELGYITGSLDGLHNKVDAIKKDVHENTGRIHMVEKRQDKARNIALGVITPVMGGWTYVILQWDKISQFFGFGGHHGS